MILLTGNKGFIGSHLQEALQQQHQIITLDCGTDLATWRKSFSSLNPKNIDLVIHAGAISDSRATGQRLWLMNYEATKELAEWAFYRNTKLLFLSSCTAIDPQHDYGWTKRVAEDILTMIIPSRNRCILRLFNVWALDEPIEKANRSIIHKLVTGNLKHVYRDCVRAFVHITDVVSAVLQLTEHWVSGIYEVRANERTMIEELVDSVYAKITIPIPKPTLIDCPIAKDIPAYTLKLTGWEAKIEVSEKINDIRKALQNHYLMRGIPKDDPEYASMLELRKRNLSV